MNLNKVTTTVTSFVNNNYPGSDGLLHEFFPYIIDVSLPYYLFIKVHVHVLM